MTVIYKTESEIWGLSPQKIWRPKNVKFCWNFGLRNLIANISRWEHDIVDQKTALETTITPLRAYQIWWTLVHKRRKIGPAFRPTQSTFSDAHISGAKRSCHLKSSQLLEDDQRLLMHTSVGMGLPLCPQQFLTPEIGKLAKNLVYFGLYRWGNCTKLSYLMSPYSGIKCPHLILGVLLP